MKQNIFNKILTGASLLAMTACSLNSWNDDLKGFEEGVNYDIVTSIEYTLTDADYAAIASNATNIALAAADDAAKELQAVGTQHSFNSKITAQKYLPAFLGSTSFQYFTLDNKSAVVATYNVATGLSQQSIDVPSAYTYTVTEDNYISAWGSDDNYIGAYAPSHPASNYLPKILKAEFPEAEAGQYAVVTYNMASQEPVFGTVGGNDTPNVPEGWELTNTVANVKLNDEVTINGIVTGVCAQGYIITDASGSILVYYGTKYSGENNINDAVTVSGKISSYNNGFQIAPSDEETVGTWKYVYPEPVVYDGAKMQDAVLNVGTENKIAQYVQLTAAVSISGNYVNFDLEGQGNTQGSAYQITNELKSQITSGNTYVIKGYFTSVSKSGGAPKFFNVLVTELAPVAAAPKAASTRASLIEVQTATEYATYHFDGSAWTIAENTVTLSEADYRAMGQKYNNLTTPDEFIPTYLRTKYPYAVAEQSVNVVYFYYANSKSTPANDLYVYNGSEWVKDLGIVVETNQFAKANGKWLFDPNVNMKWDSSDEAKLWWQACVEWVFNNKDVPMFGSTGIKSGMGFVTTYGNNEFYSGSGYYQCNVDIRPSSPTGASGVGNNCKEYWTKLNLSDDEVVAALKHNFEAEVLPGALSMIFPDADLIDGYEDDINYTIEFQSYDGARIWQTAVYKLVGKGKFEFVSCTWNN